MAKGSKRTDYECCRHCGSIVCETGETVDTCPHCGAEDWQLGSRVPFDKSKATGSHASPSGNGEKKAEPIEAEATIIEEEIAPLSGLDKLIGEIEGEAKRLAKKYEPHEIKDAGDFTRSKNDRADARKGIASLKVRYADEMGAIKAAVAEADARMRCAIAPLDEIDRGYKERIDTYDAACKERRKATLREAYEDLAPFIALPREEGGTPILPFERLMERYGNKKGSQWTSMARGSEGKALKSLEEAVADVAQAEKTIDSMVEPDYREAAKARYFRTLDLQATLAEEAEAKAQRERVARLERERQERIAAEEAARRKAEEDAWLERQAAEPVEPGTVRVVAPPSYSDEAAVANNVDGTEPLVPAPVAPPAPPAPVPMGQETGREMGHVPAPAPAGYAHEWTVAVISATKAQMEGLAEYMRANGIMFEKVYSGSVGTAYEKWRSENA